MLMVASPQMTVATKQIPSRDVSIIRLYTALVKGALPTNAMAHRGTERISQKELHLARQQTSQSMG